MKKYRCKKRLFLDCYDDEGRYDEKSVVIIPDGSIWQLDESGYRVIGDWDDVRLIQDDGLRWIEITAEDLAEYFEEVQDGKEN